jgi:hypothetical protein
MRILNFVAGFIVAIVALFIIGGVTPIEASTLTASDMQEIEAFISDVAKAQGQAKVFWFALQKIKANPARVEAILKSVNLWDKI